MEVPTLVSDIYPLIHAYLDPPSKVMMSISCRRFLKLGISRKARGRALIREASRYGHLKIIQYARKHNVPWSALSCELAAQYGHFEVLKWIREHGCEWDRDTCSRAAYGGHLEILKWVREHGCEWSEDTCYYATQKGHLEILQWLRTNNCPWRLEEILQVATPEILEWIRGLEIV